MWTTVLGHQGVDRHGIVRRDMSGASKLRAKKARAWTNALEAVPKAGRRRQPRRRAPQWRVSLTRGAASGAATGSGYGPTLTMNDGAMGFGDKDSSGGTRGASRGDAPILS
jgi:hypothetical protein